MMLPIYLTFGKSQSYRSREPIGSHQGSEVQRGLECKGVGKRNSLGRGIVLYSFCDGVYQHLCMR